MALCCCFPCLRLGQNTEVSEEDPLSSPNGGNRYHDSSLSRHSTVSPMHVNREDHLEMPGININVRGTEGNGGEISSLYIDEGNFNILSDLGAGLASPRGQEEDEYGYFCPICFLNFRGIYRSKCCNNYFCYSCLHEYVAKKYNASPEDLPILQLPFSVEVPCPHCGTENFEPEHVQSNESIRSYGEREKNFDDMELQLRSGKITSSSVPTTSSSGGTVSSTSSTSPSSVYDSCSTITSTYEIEMDMATKEEMKSYNTNTTTTTAILSTNEQHLGLTEENKEDRKTSLLSPIRVGDSFEKLGKKMQKYEDITTLNEKETANVVNSDLTFSTSASLNTKENCFVNKTVPQVPNQEEEPQKNKISDDKSQKFEKIGEIEEEVKNIENQKVKVNNKEDGLKSD